MLESFEIMSHYCLDFDHLLLGISLALNTLKSTREKIIWYDDAIT